MIFYYIHYSEDQTATIETILPDSITTWNINTIYLDPKSGMCVHPAQEVIVQKEVFMRVHMPQKIVRGEHMKMVVALHNLLDKNVHIEVSLEHVGTIPIKRATCFLKYLV